MRDRGWLRSMPVVAAVGLSGCANDATTNLENGGSVPDMDAGSGTEAGRGDDGDPGTSKPGGGGDAGGGGRDAGAPSAVDSGPADGGTPADSNAARDSGSVGTADCNSPNLVWRSANKTNFTSYPDPGSEECIKYNGCAYEGQFAACPSTETKAWVQAHNIVAVFPNLNNASNGISALALHDLCLKSGADTIVVTVLDECADSDCSGCCTQNKGSADELIDVESFTDARWGVPDGPIQWADLGPTRGTGCQ